MGTHGAVWTLWYNVEQVLSLPGVPSYRAPVPGLPLSTYLGQLVGLRGSQA